MSSPYRGRLRLGFALRLALRESRHSLRRVGVYMASITLGVAALVSIHSFRDDFARSVQEGHDALLNVKAVFGLVEGNAAIPVHDLIGNLFAAVGGQVVHNESLGRGFGE